MLALGMLATGRLELYFQNLLERDVKTYSLSHSINTISTKLADMQCVPDNRISTDILPVCTINATSGACSAGCRQFNHPFAQVPDYSMFERKRSAICLYRYNLYPNCNS